MLAFCMINTDISRGCRAGASCPYLHDSVDHERKYAQPKASHAQENYQANRNAPAQDAFEDGPTAVRHLSLNDSRLGSGPPVISSPCFTSPQKPISNAESSDPREFQINQLRRRFRPKESNDASGTSLSFGMAPSDPDFPFDSIPKEGNSDIIQGLQRGIMQYKVDKKMDHLIPSYRITKNIPRKSHSKDKGIDKDDIDLE